MYKAFGELKGRYDSVTWQQHLNDPAYETFISGISFILSALPSDTNITVQGFTSTGRLTGRIRVWVEGGPLPLSKTVPFQASPEVSVAAWTFVPGAAPLP